MVAGLATPTGSGGPAMAAVEVAAGAVGDHFERRAPQQRQPGERGAGRSSGPRRRRPRAGPLRRRRAAQPQRRGGAGRAVERDERGVVGGRVQVGRPGERPAHIGGIDGDPRRGARSAPLPNRTLPTSRNGRPATQCAAVATRSGAISAAPQKGILANHGADAARARARRPPRPWPARLGHRSRRRGRARRRHGPDARRQARRSRRGQGLGVPYFGSWHR